jgi:hypothetical protein
MSEKRSIEPISRSLVLQECKDDVLAHVCAVNYVTPRGSELVSLA